ncbi:EF hand domain-containing protein [Ditylenchus destructor]|uniref:EF hand domain-containing protein n=1 Tax=Ditylenchus destructor TaxID=166010 RepID=A0AAD4MHW4_9BILA|nr:EF hand domain-containing protein [Ditylenchus destructor]
MKVSAIVFVAFITLIHIATVRSDAQEEKFKQVDANGDGKLSVDEVKAALVKKGVPEDKADAVARKIFEIVDTDKDGYITLEEDRKNPIEIPHGN